MPTLRAFLWLSLPGDPWLFLRNDAAKVQERSRHTNLCEKKYDGKWREGKYRCQALLIFHDFSLSIHQFCGFNCGHLSQKPQKSSKTRNRSIWFYPTMPVSSESYCGTSPPLRGESCDDFVDAFGDLEA